MKINTIKKVLKLIGAGETLFDKVKIFYYFFASYIELRKSKDLPFRISIKIGDEVKILTRKNKPNDIWMGTPEESKKFFNYVKKNGHQKIIDIGANIGKYSLVFAENPSAEVISFEPEKNNYIALKSNIKYNKIKNITAYNLGCYNKEKMIKFYLSPINEGGHSVIYDKKCRVTQIKVVRLDDFLEKIKFGKIDLIKIDVEGVELKVLEGAKKNIKKYRPDIFFEVSRDERKIRSFLESMGYIIYFYGGSNYLAKMKK